MCKRLLSLLLAISFCVMPFVFVSAAESDSKEVILLRDLGILESAAEEGLYEDRFNYTKEKFAKSLAMMVRDYEPPILQNQIALDIPDNEYMPYINFALSNEYMTVDAKKRFYPDEVLDLDTVIYGLVSILDYDIMAMEEGGTALAFKSVAAKVGILRNVNIKNPDKITIPELAQMIMNTMKIAPMVMPGEVVSPYKPTLLEQKDLKKESGRILANSNIGLIINKCPKNFVNIDGKLYRTNLYIEDAAVGTIVTYYTQKIDEELHVVSLYGGNNEEIISINADEIESVSFSGSYIEITYGNEKEAQIDYTAFVLINGNSQIGLSRELFDVFNSGNLKLIDSDDDGTCDIVHMMIYKTEVVEGAGNTSNSIVTRYTNETISLDAAGDSVSIYRDNIAISVAQIVSGNVINIACDAIDLDALKGGSLKFDYDVAKQITIHASNKQISGVLNRIENGNVIYVDDLDYQISDFLAGMISSKVRPILMVGQPVILCLDYYDKVIDFETDDSLSTMEYGYLVDAVINSQSLDRSLMLKVLSEDGNINVYEVAEKYILDSKSGVLSDTLTPNVNVDFNKRQLVRYRVSGGLIREIDTLHQTDYETADSSLQLEYDTWNDGDEENIKTKEDEETYYSSTYRFNSFKFKCTLSNNTVIFRVPPAENEIVEDKQFTRVARSFLKQDDTTRYFVHGFDLDQMLYAGCVLIYDAAEAKTSMTKDDLTFMVGDVSKAVNADGVVRLRIEVLGRTVSQGNGESRFFFLAEDAECKDNDMFLYGNDAANKGTDLNPESLRTGDIIRFLENNDGEIAYLERVCTPTPKGLREFKLGSSTRAAYVIPYMTTKESIYQYICISSKGVAAAETEDFATFLVNFFRTVYVYDVNDNKITSTEDMTTLPTYVKAANTTMFVHIAYSDIVNVFVYQWD